VFPDHAPDPQPAESTRTCPSCSAEFTPDPTTRQTYCAPACRPSHQKPEIVLAVKNCPECRDDFTCHPSIRQVYCSPRCRKDAELRRELHRDQERAARLGGTTRPRPEPAARTETPILRPTQRQQTTKRDPLEPAATRNCPHCDQPITIVALLATPEAARPAIPGRIPDVVPMRRP
jgi:hypothetical protein